MPLNIYSPYGPRSNAYILGDRHSLEKFRNAIDEAISHNGSSLVCSDSDDEEYEIKIVDDASLHFRVPPYVEDESFGSGPARAWADVSELFNDKRSDEQENEFQEY